MIQKKISVEALKFACAGGLVTFLHIIFVYFLTSILGFWYLYSVIFSYSLAIILNFILQKFFVRMDMAIHMIKTQFVVYIIMSLIHLVLNAFFMYVLVSVLLMPYIYAQIVILCVLSVLTFFINRNFIFH